MTFAAPLFLLAALAGLIPVVLHLFHRVKAEQIRFSTLRFLRLSVRRTQRWKFLDNLVLLLLRMAAVVLLAMGLARPALTQLNYLLGRGSTTAVAIILDNSTSMGTLDGGQQQLEAARAAAGKILDQLREGDTVALFLTGGPPHSELGRLYNTHETVRLLLAQATVSMERADLATKLQQARDLLADSEANHREICIFTDNQAISWAGLQKKSETRNPKSETANPASSDFPVVVVNCSHDPVPNVALRSIRLQTPAPAPGVPVQATVEVVNTSTVPQQKNLELYVDGIRETTSPTLNLSAGALTTHTFHFVLDRPGLHRGEVRLAEQDGLELDNRLSFALMVDQEVPVAVIKPARQEIPQLEDSFYLEKALSLGTGPGEPGANTGSPGALRMTSLTPEELPTETLSNYAVIFCVNLPALDQAASERFRDYVEKGGHLFWICGSNVHPDAYGKMNAAVSNQLLPATLGEPRAPGEPGASAPGATPPGAGTGKSMRIGYLDRDNAALAPLTDPASLYQSVLVHRYFPLTPFSGARQLARLENGQPLLVERSIGSGSVLLLGTGVQVDWTNLPLKPLFLPLLARLTFSLAGIEADRSLVQAGSPLVVPLSPAAAPKDNEKAKPAEFEVQLPSSETVRVRVADPQARSFRYSATHEPGIYVVRQLDTLRARPFAFAVNGDPEESDSAQLAREELTSRFGSELMVYCERPEDLPETIRRLREGISLWEPFLWAVLLALLVEAYLANHKRN
jgi:Aerotolerance regulator N-terminal/von Willebrand factor type A domain